jgi:Bacterial Ig domain/Beta-propeller repeat/Carboxypeptidase regulatory-like domain
MIAGLTSLSALLYLSSTKFAGATSTDLTERTGAKALPAINTRASAIGTASSEAVKEQIGEAYGKLPLSFEANVGQADERVKFISRGVGYTLFLTSDEAVLSLRDAQGSDRAGERDLRTPHVLRMRLKGANPSPSISSLDELPGRSNYFTGSDRSKWRAGVRNYARAQYSQVYPGIDLVYYGNQRQLEYDFIVAPGADPKTIALNFGGAEKIEVDGSGDLVLHTPGGKVRQRKPVLYQEVNGERQMVAGSYALRGRDEAGFNVGDYDASKPLVIDPVLEYSTYLGSSGSGDVGYDVAVDKDGNAYVTGYTNFDDYPTTAGAFQRTFLGGPYDAFVTKFNAAGTALLYSTYLGGTLRDEGYGISVSADGQAYITGFTNSPDFPTMGAFQATFGGGPSQTGDAFVTVLNSTGSALVYSTYLGGADSDLGNSIALDAAGNAYVTGRTSSTNFPTATPVQAALNGVVDAFITKLNPTGTALLYSTYLGGAADSFPNGTTAPDSGNGIAVDAGGNAYITGAAGSTDFPVTPGAFQQTIGGSQDFIGDAFVAKLNDTGTALVYSTYLGGLRGDDGAAIAVDATGNAYVTGQTQSTNFPVKNPIRATNDDDYDADAFITKLNSTGTALIYSTYLGSSHSERGNDIVVDSQNRATVTGTTNSFFFHIVNPPVQEKPGGSTDAFVTSLNATGTSIFYSSYVGGSGNESGNGIGVDTNDNIYLTGSTTSITTNPYLNPFPTANPFRANRNGQGDAFVSKISVGAVSFSISGRVIDGNGGVSGTGVNLGGSRRERTVTDANGNYIFRNLKGGRSYTVTPVTSFGSFLPESRTFNNLNTNETANFALAYKIIGRITDRSNNGLSGVTVSLTGSQTGTTQTDSSGDYEFSNLAAGGSYTVTPSLAGSYFTPPKWTIDSLTNHQSLGFTAGPLPAPWTYESDIGSVGGAGNATYDNGTFTINGSGADIGGTADAFHYVHQRLTTTDGEIVARVKSIENTSPDAKAGIMFRDEDFSPESRYAAMLVTPSGSVLFQRRTATGGLTTTTVSNGSAPVWLKLVRRGNDTYRGYKSVDGASWQLVGSATIPMSQYLYAGMVVSSHDNSALCAATFDNVAAKITITTPEEGAAFPANSSIPISAVVSGFANKVDFYANNTLIGTDTTSPYTISWDGAKPAGDYTLTARATDTHGTTPSSAVKIRITGSTAGYTISGWVRSPAGGVKGVKMTLSGSEARTMTTLDDGSYSFTGLAAGGNYKVTPSRVNVAFTPASRSFTGLSANQPNINFAPAPVTISGVVKVGSTGLGNVRMTLTSPGLASRTVMTATSGNIGSFKFANLPAGRTYTITPSRLSYKFTPTSRTYSNLIGNQPTANFAATLVTYSITGKVARPGTTVGIIGVTMTITSPTPAGFAPRTVQTNNYGIYTFTSLPSGRNYTIKPTKSGFTFNPVERNFTNLSGNAQVGATTRFEGTQ